jgi:hypothetical protein
MPVPPIPESHAVASPVSLVEECEIDPIHVHFTLSPGLRLEPAGLKKSSPIFTPNVVAPRVAGQR